jgi:hypothetical protein
MWIWRRMEGIKWSDKVTNEEVLKRIGIERQLMDTIRNRKRKWIGHVIREEGLLKEIIEGRMEGKRNRGRPRVGMLDNLIMHTYVEMKRRTEERKKNWRSYMPWTCQ